VLWPDHCVQDTEGAQIARDIKIPQANLITHKGFRKDVVHALANVEVVTGATVSGLEGRDGMLQAVRWRLGTTGEEIRRPVSHLFLFIGAEPNTDWLSGSGITLDPKGFVLTGNDAGDGRHLLETTRRGVFAIGDVRAKSVKRVAAAVGEGAYVVAALHVFLTAASPILTNGPTFPIQEHEN
jgi:thioredoxin reductase (NADPH)